MKNPNAIVSAFVRFDRPAAEPGAEVELEDGRRARLDPSDKRSAGWAKVLGGLSEQRLPVYLELEPETSVITHLLIPQVARVVGLRPLGEDAIDVQLDYSHARHVLRRGYDDFEELERELRAAHEAGRPVIVTENDAHEIIHVRDFVPSPEGPPFPLEPEIPPPKNWIDRLWELLLRFWRWCWWPWRWFRCCISEVRAQQVFDAMKATSCNPSTVPPPCIPFLYPDDGCWARAHEMCRLMLDMGLRPKKVWIQGGLHVPTRNNPNCEVNWGWHVAPTLCVRSGIVKSTRKVIDPSLFDTPVTKEQWKQKQEDPNATLTDSECAIYYLWWNETDPDYSKTNDRLAYYRLQLQNRSNQHGPPPYAHCP